MTNKKNDEVVEVDGEKGEKPENVVVHVHKDGAEKIEKLKKTLTSKKSTSTRFVNKLKEQAVKFKSAAETDNRDNTSTTKTALKITAEQLIDTRNKLKKHASEVEKLAEEISDTLIQYSATGAEEKLETDAHGITDSIEETLSEYITIISEAIDASKEVTPQRNSSAPATGGAVQRCAEPEAQLPGERCKSNGSPPLERASSKLHRGGIQTSSTT